MRPSKLTFQESWFRETPKPFSYPETQFELSPTDSSSFLANNRQCPTLTMILTSHCPIDRLPREIRARAVLRGVLVGLLRLGHPRALHFGSPTDEMPPIRSRVTQRGSRKSHSSSIGPVSVECSLPLTSIRAIEPSFNSFHPMLHD